MMGINAHTFHGKMVTCRIKPVANHPVEMSSTVIDTESEMSCISTSYVSLFNILPRGVVSKYDMGALIKR